MSGTVCIALPSPASAAAAAAGRRPPPPPRLAIAFVNYPRAVYISLTVVPPAPAAAGDDAGLGNRGALPAAAGSHSLVIATPPLTSSGAGEPAVSVVLAERGAEPELLSSLAAKFCRRLKRMVLLSADVGVRSAGAGDASAAAAAAAGGLEGGGGAFGGGGMMGGGSASGVAAFEEDGALSAVAHKLALQAVGGLLA